MWVVVGRTGTIATLRTLPVATLALTIATLLGTLAIAALLTGLIAALALAIATLLRTLTVATLLTGLIAALAIAALLTRLITGLLFVAILIIAGTIAALLTRLIATLLGALAITAVIIKTVRARSEGTLRSLALQSCSKALGSEATFIVIVPVVGRAFVATLLGALPCTNTRTR